MLFDSPKTPKPKISTKDLKNQRLMNLGALTTAVVHDLNNLHAGMQALVAVMKRQAKDSSLQSSLDTLEESSKHAGRLSNSILHYFKDTASCAHCTDPIACLNTLAKLAKQTLTQDITFEMKLPQTPLPIGISQTDLCQIFLNLFFNAKEAIVKSGFIHVFAHYQTEEQPHYFILEVEDSGPGIPKNLRKSIFQAFFSTKSAKGGSGLGLCIIHNIITQAQGTIDVQSGDGRTTKFRICLPLS